MYNNFYNIIASSIWARVIARNDSNQKNSAAWRASEKKQKTLIFKCTFFMAKK